VRLWKKTSEDSNFNGVRGKTFSFSSTPCVDPDARLRPHPRANGRVVGFFPPATGCPTWTPERNAAPIACAISSKDGG
jgi:hypothetical protein